MLKSNKLRWALAVLATLAAYSIAIQPACAKGGGHGGGGHGGGGHGGDHHGGAHHGGEHHGGDHHAGHDGGHGDHNHHPYHPSQHHTAHHSHDHHGDHHGDHDHDHHHDHHHTAHHHHNSWHNGGWGPGFWGGAALGYGLGYGYDNWDAARNWALAGDGGDTYVDNSVDNSTTGVTPASNESDGSDDSASDESSDQTSDNSDSNSAPNGPNGRGGFPTDDWPELGVTTYAGQYGASQGQVIVRIVPGSAAEKAGLVPGDVILSFNGKPVPSADDLDAAMDGANGKFEVVVWDARTGRQSTIDGNLDAAGPQPNETAAIPPVQQ